MPGSHAAIRPAFTPTSASNARSSPESWNAALALRLADHAYLLETGRVVISGTAESIRNDESVRRSYLGY